MFSTKAAIWGARRGSLVVNGAEIPTPNFIVSTTRGAIDHLTPEHTRPAPMSGIYAEELYDRDGLLKHCISGRNKLPLNTKILLGACRKPGSRTIINKPNGMDSIAIDTVQGSKLAPLSAMMEFMSLLQPDLFLIPYDIPAQTQSDKVGHNRLRKMEVRSLEWFRQFIVKRLELGKNPGDLMLVVSIPPELSTPEYISQVDEQCDAYCFTTSKASGSRKIPEDLANPKKLRLSDQLNTDWCQVLNDISFGSDLVHIPLTNYADAGHALMFQWNPTLESTSELQDSYMDLNDKKFATNMDILGKTGYSLAYIHHLLNANEMTAQVLLQQHNLEIIEQLFDGLRQSIEKGTFEEDKNSFLERYKISNP